VPFFRSIAARNDRDYAGFPDGGLLAKISPWTQTPLLAVWATTILSILPGLLDLASPIAANAIFSLCAIALDSSYIIPIFLCVPSRVFSHRMILSAGYRRRWYSGHPEVVFTPGPFYMKGALGWVANVTCIVWTVFVCIIFSFPNIRPVTPQNMNYAAVSRARMDVCVVLTLRTAYPRRRRHTFWVRLSLSQLEAMY
jgi:amino acid transporter